MGPLNPDVLAPQLESVAAAVQAAFPSRVQLDPPFRGQLILTLAAPDDVVSVLRWLRDDSSCAFRGLADVTAVDHLDRCPRFDVVYHLFSLAPPARIEVKVGVDEDTPVPSVTCLWSGANFAEREVFDLFGLTFTGHPNLTRILLPDDYEGHPLRRDASLGDVPVDFDLPDRKRFSHA